MASPGTGAGMQARALEGTARLIHTLMEYAKSFPPGTPQFNGYVTAIKALNAVSKPAGTDAPKDPLPLPAAPPGGMGGPPPGGGMLPMGGAGGPEPPGGI
jgi:hypothetical protein